MGCQFGACVRAQVATAECRAKWAPFGEFRPFWMTCPARNSGDRLQESPGLIHSA